MMGSKVSPQALDITPTPRILRTLGDIPFSAWQCLAELTDNSIDGFHQAEATGKTIEEPRVDIYWSSENTAEVDREIVIEDNGLGMDLEVLQQAAKAGYSSNDPIHNLGLFGMGFNIATARLGDETIFLSATRESKEWVGIKIDFEQLIRDGTFAAPIVSEPKRRPEDSGTKVIVRKLKQGTYSELKAKETNIRRQLEIIYSPILGKNKFTLFVQGKQLSPRPHCIWGDSRFVTRRGVRFEAVQRIDRDLGDSYFDVSRNRYLSDDEYASLSASQARISDTIVKRSRRLKGWIGIQRYADPSDFGIDFIRNGRKILVSDKSLFSYENPDTGTDISEYPIELGTTVGGRIVGELHVDYLIPTYQKNSFDTNDRAWRLTREAVRGAGPILPRRRSLLGYDGENDSPLGLLVNAYRRTDAGTKNLAIPNQLAKELAKKFRAGDPDYQTDDKWFSIAQETDRDRSDKVSTTSPVNSGDLPSDDLDQYLNEPPEPNTSLAGEDNGGLQVAQSGTVPLLPTSERDELIQHSNKQESLSGVYAYGSSPGFTVTAWRLREGRIRLNGESVPSHAFQDGVELDYFYDPTHQVLSEYAFTPKLLLLQMLAEKFALRDRGISIQTAFLGLISNHLEDERINQQALRERGQAIVDTIRERLPILLGDLFEPAKQLISAVEAEVEELGNRLLEDAPELLSAYERSDSDAAATLAFVSPTSIVRLIEAFPGKFMDSKLFKLPYSTIHLGNEQVQRRLRDASLKRITSYITDTVLLTQGSSQTSKEELMRHANTLTLLEGLIV